MGAVVKANAYGLGARPIATALYQAGCRHFFVAYPAEGAALRAVVPEAAIFVLQGILPETVQVCLEERLNPVLNSHDQLLLWQAACKGHPAPPAAALNINTGMNRNGFDTDDLQRLADLPSIWEAVPLTHYFSHLASSDAAEDPFNAFQLKRFLAAVSPFPPRLRCLANSNGVFLGKAYHFDLIRPGAALYGFALSSLVPPNLLQPVVTLTSKVTQVFKALKGESVGYNQTHILQRDSRLLTVGIGYADGISRHMSNRGQLYLQGYPLPIVGRISMDCTVVDATDLPATLGYLGQEVEVIGPNAPLLAFAEASGTTPYAVLAAISQQDRVLRRYS